jgi:uncharacterized phage-associated protein
MSAPDRGPYSVRGLANWILDLAEERGLSITNMAINKIVYFAYERLLVEKDRRLTNAKIEAWEHGPVFREIYQSFKHHGDRPIVSRAKFYSPDTGDFERVGLDIADDDREYIANVVIPLLPLSASKLRDMSHIPYGPWYNTWWHKARTNPGMEISPADIISSAELEGYLNEQS